jgi:hypothetical protein
MKKDKKPKNGNKKRKSRRVKIIKTPYTPPKQVIDAAVKEERDRIVNLIAQTASPGDTIGAKAISAAILGISIEELDESNFTAIEQPAEVS